MDLFRISKELPFKMCKYGKPFASPLTGRRGKLLKRGRRDFPEGPVVNTSLSNAGSVGSIPGRGAKKCRKAPFLAVLRKPLHASHQPNNLYAHTRTNHCEQDTQLVMISD